MRTLIQMNIIQCHILKNKYWKLLKIFWFSINLYILMIIVNSRMMLSISYFNLYKYIFSVIFINNVINKYVFIIYYTHLFIKVYKLL